MLVYLFSLGEARAPFQASVLKIDNGRLGELHSSLKIHLAHGPKK